MVTLLRLLLQYIDSMMHCYIPSLRVSSKYRVHNLSYLQKRAPEAKLSFDPPEVFVTEEYLIPPTNSQSEARKQEVVTEQSAISTEDRKDNADT